MQSQEVLVGSGTPEASGPLGLVSGDSRCESPHKCFLSREALHRLCRSRCKGRQDLCLRELLTCLQSRPGVWKFQGVHQRAALVDPE